MPPNNWRITLCPCQRGGALINTAVTKVRSAEKQCNLMHFFSQYVQNLHSPENPNQVDCRWHFACNFMKVNRSAWILPQIYLKSCRFQNWQWQEWERCSLVHVWWALPSRYVLYNRSSGCPFMWSPPVSVRRSLIQPFVSVGFFSTAIKAFHDVTWNHNRMLMQHVLISNLCVSVCKYVEMCVLFPRPRVMPRGASGTLRADLKQGWAARTFTPLWQTWLQM